MQGAVALRTHHVHSPAQCWQVNLPFHKSTALFSYLLYYRNGPLSASCSTRLWTPHHIRVNLTTSWNNAVGWGRGSAKTFQITWTCRLWCNKRLIGFFSAQWQPRRNTFSWLIFILEQTFPRSLELLFSVHMGYNGIFVCSLSPWLFLLLFN